MIVIVLFMAALAATAAWWLASQGLATRPWLETDLASSLPAPATSSLPEAKLGLGIFLAVAGALLALLISAYIMRMDMEDWRPLPWPKLLWFNTGVLVLSSIALHAAQVAARRDAMAGVRIGLLAGGIGAVVFLIGQILAWRQLTAAGYRLSTNPADAFFYLITAVHGLHVLGGLVALGRTVARPWHGRMTAQLRLSVELCATYWHFLLLAWIILFALLAFAPSFLWLYAICTASLG
jgi:cytochrome c oxidase subunit 3